jgi:hypothetical protein
MIAHQFFFDKMAKERKVMANRNIKLRPIASLSVFNISSVSTSPRLAKKPAGINAHWFLLDQAVIRLKRIANRNIMAGAITSLPKLYAASSTPPARRMNIHRKMAMILVFRFVD